MYSKTKSTRIAGALAGIVGFEPTNSGVKDRCLTAWQYPIKRYLNMISQSCPAVKRTSENSLRISESVKFRDILQNYRYYDFLNFQFNRIRYL